MTRALFEAAKGALVLVVGFGLAALLHGDAQRFAALLVGRRHLNPAKRYPTKMYFEDRDANAR